MRLADVVANMFFIPAAIWQGAPGLSVGYYIWKSMIPALIGNIVGGGLFVGVMYWYLVGYSMAVVDWECLLTVAIVHLR